MTNKRRNQDDPIALRKQLIQMRLELNRQKLRHEGHVLLEPIQKLRGYQQRFSQSSKPLLMVVGVSLVSFLMARNHRSVRNVLPILRVASSFLPFLMAESRPTTRTTSEQPDNLTHNKAH